MKIYSINQAQYHNSVKRNSIRKTDSAQTQQIAQPSFKGAGGGVFGFMTGGAAGLALTAAALTTPVGWIAAAALYGGTIVGAATGAVVGHKLGDKIDPDDDNKKKKP